MKRFDFSTFEVSPGNQRALALCRRVANIQPVSPLPVLLLGPSGSGKTHLLYAIVNAVRASVSKTGLAYVTAHEFPEQVRALIADPTPLTRAESAILLVDQLEAFTQDLDELEAVCRLFLDHGYHVVLASNIHPARLPQLGPSFRAWIESGETIDIRRRGDAPESALERVLESEPTTAIRKRTRVPDVVEFDKLDALRDRMTAIERSRDEEMAAALDTARREKEELERTLEGLRQETDTLREQFEEIREKAAQSETLLSDKTALEAQVAVLKEELIAAQKEGVIAQQEANQLVQRAEKLLAHVENGRTQFEESERAYQARIEELEARLDAFEAGAAEFERMQDEAKAAQGALAALRDESVSTRTRLEMELDLARREARKEHDAQEGLQARYAAEAAGLAPDQETWAKSWRGGADRASLELEVGQLREELDAQVREVARLEKEAGDHEARVQALYSTFDLTRQTARVVGVGLEGIREDLLGAVEALSKLAKRLAQAAEIPADALEGGRRPRDASATKPREGRGGVFDAAPPAEPIELPDVGIKFPKPEL
ncbi:MAG TPA: DnaA/Hda family protein [Candidatus Hydrogenedentes bacterium]|nr:DnaA/Hda family protein [Candidatus Hydrogenedentota bacterium]HPG65629.1 DnaA/Hda family protein [Candidatus Hydrogenedentota bacterium]